MHFLTDNDAILLYFLSHEMEALISYHLTLVEEADRQSV